MGTVKSRNGMNTTEAEYVKTRWQEYTEDLYRKDFNDPDDDTFNDTRWCDHSPRARYPGMQSQVGLGKHHHEQS